jgi:pre-mRNA branch site protein p14
MDAKLACDKLNGFNFQSRYLVGELGLPLSLASHLLIRVYVVLYHQPEKMVKSKEDLEARKENLEQLKKQHGIE